MNQVLYLVEVDLEGRLAELEERVTGFKNYLLNVDCVSDNPILLYCMLA